VPAGAALRASGDDEAQPVVLPEGLRMQPRQLSGDGDGEDRRLFIDLVVLAHRSSPPFAQRQLRAFANRSARGFSFGSSSRKRSSASRALSSRWDGTTTCTS